MPLPLPHVPGVAHETVDLDGLRVHVATAGEGPPVVLLHGWPQHWYAWRRVIPLLARHHRVMCPDLRGAGWSDAPPGRYDKEQLASDLIAVLDASGLGEVDLVGHDWGGWVGFLAALRRPDRIRRLLALSISHPWPSPDARLLDAWRLGYQLALAAPVVGPALLRRLPGAVPALMRAATSRPGTFRRADLEAYAAPLRDPARAAASSALYRTFLTREVPRLARGRYAGTRLRVPTRLLVGDGDPVITARQLPGWEDHADDMAVRLLPGTGHFVPEEEPGAVAAAVLSPWPRGGWPPAAPRLRGQDAG